MAHDPAAAAAYEHNGRPVSRQAFYAIACDPRRSVAVEACAGAGKTWMLVSRIVRALLDGCPAHEILAITFTKKAAGEMRQRLHEWLAEFAQATPERLRAELAARGITEENSPQPLPDLVLALQNLQHTLLSGGRPVPVRTFHSWFAALLRSAPLALLEQLGLPARHELLDDDSEAVARVWRRFHAALLQAPEPRADFEALVAQHGRSATRKALEEALARRTEFALADAAGVVQDSVPRFDALFPEFAGLATPQQAVLGPLRPGLQAAAQALGRASARTFAEKGVALEQALTDDQAEAVVEALFTQKLEPRKFSDKLAGIEAVRTAQDALLRVLEAQAQHEAWAYQQRLMRLTRLLLAEYAALKREHGWVDMNDVERTAWVLLSDPVLSGWVQERLDTRVRQLLIDEFQDTNPLQWQALHAWLSGYVGAGGGAGAPSVFIVGDPKQSIYRFRRAEPQVFRAAQDFIVHGLGGARLSCDHTRRNAPAVIDAVNQALGAAQAAGEVEGFRPHSTESRQAGGLACLPPVARADAAASDGDSADLADGAAWRDSLTTPRTLPEDSPKLLECRQAAHWLHRQLQAQGLQPADCMVLSRRRERLVLMQDELRALHLATEQPEKTELGDAPEVQDLVALLDALVSPTHDLSLARALKSPLFGLDDADLVSLALAQRRARADGQALGWLAVLHSPVHCPEPLRTLAPVLARYRQWVAELPPHDALDAIYHHGDVLARYAQAAPAPLREGVLANLQALLSAALQLDGGRYATPYALVRALKAGGLRAPQRAQPGAVRLLTVHGAKGLEAELVLLLDTDAAPPRAQTMGVLIDWPGEAAAPQRLAFLASETRPPPSLREALRAEQAARQREELNALYVAMTRARRQLVLSSVAPRHAQPGSWWQRLQPLADAVPVSVSVPDTVAPPGPAEGQALAPCGPHGAGPAAVPEGRGPAPVARPATPGGAGARDAVQVTAVDTPAAPAPRASTAGPGPTEPEAELWLRVLPDLPPALAVSGVYAMESGAFGRATGASPGSAAGGSAADEPAASDLPARLGLAMHRLLEWVHDPAQALTPTQVAAAAREFALAPAQAEQAAAMARRILAGEGAWAWTPALLDWAGNEVALVHAGQLLRPDRLVRRRDTGAWWVLDYKSAAQPQQQPALRAQLQQYRAALQALNPGATVHAAFLTAEGTLQPCEAVP